MLEVSLIGCMHTRVDGKPYGLGFGGSSRSLAAYLFTYLDQPHRRSKVANLFWPELDEVKAGAALNSALWRIKNHIFKRWGLPCTAVQSNSDYVAVCKEDFFDVDHLKLQRMAESILKADFGSVSIDDHLIRQFIAYDGLLLEGESGLWAEEERERANSNFIRAGIKVVRFCCLQKRYDSSIDICRNLLSIDPYREKVVRYHLALLAVSERREEALRTFRIWRSMIASELSIEPYESTVHVANRINNLASSREAMELLAETLDLE